MSFDTADITINATERMAYGFTDERAFYGRMPTKEEERIQRLWHLGETVFRTEAQARGYCMIAWDLNVPRGMGKVEYGVLHA